MIDPRAGIPLIGDAYALAQGGSIAAADDICDGRDQDGVIRPMAIKRRDDIGIRGTLTFGRDVTEFIQDAEVLPWPTPYGLMGIGVWKWWQTLKWRSGKPWSAFFGCNVHGHSAGAGLAAVTSAAVNGAHVLWECPNWFSKSFADKFPDFGGYVFAVASDPVCWLPFPIPLVNPQLGPVTHLLPPHGVAGLEAHEFVNCVAAYNAAFPQPKAA